MCACQVPTRTRRILATLDGTKLQEAVRELLHSKSVRETEDYAWLLRSCGKARDLIRGRLVHAHIRTTQLHQLTYIGNLLVEMYGRCGSLEDARAVFDDLQQPNNYSWNIMIAAYAQNGHLQEAKSLFERMPLKTSVSSNALIAALSKAGDLSEARKMFDELSDRTIISWNSMITAYITNGHLGEARLLFNRMEEKDVVSWTAMITAYTHKGELQQATRMFEEMPERNVVTWNAMLVANAREGDVNEARRHFDLMPQRDLVSWTSMINAYGHNGMVGKAREVFDEMPERDEAAWNSIIAAYASTGDAKEAGELFRRMPCKDGVSWNVMLSAYIECGEFEEAIEIFERMPSRDKVSCTAMVGAFAEKGRLNEARELFDTSAEKDVVSWKCMLSAYVQAGDVKNARALFGLMPERHISAWNILIAAYAQTGDLPLAKATFDGMPEHDLVSWNTMMGAFSQNGRYSEAIQLFRDMDVMGLQLDTITFLTALDACTESLDYENGSAIHERAVQIGLHSQVPVSNAMISMHGRFGNVEAAKTVFDEMADRDIISHNAMLSAYAQNGHIAEAKELFDNLSARDTVSWNSIIGGYTQNGDPRQALQMFRLMDLEGFQPSNITFVVAVDVCASLASLQEARVLHRTLLESDTPVDVVLANALINMYGKCGSMKEARSVFDRSLHAPDSVPWNAMIAAYAQYGHGEEALRFFETMNLYGVFPDEITFVLVLSVCAHSGLLKDGLEYFWSISQDYRCEPIPDYYACMVDVFGRSGQLRHAEELIETMPFYPNSAVWMSLLGSSNLHGDKERGLWAAEVASKLDPADSSAYVLLSNMYKHQLHKLN